MKKKPLVLSTHGTLLGYKRYLQPGKAHFPYRLYDALTLRFAVRKAHAVVVSSHLEYEDAVEFGVDKEKIHIIPPGIDLDPDFPETPVRHGGPLRILFAGRIARVRRVELLLRAVSKITLPFKLTLAGGEESTSSVTRPGYLKELKRQAQILGIDDHVEFAGRMSREKMRETYKKADLFVYPSTYENFGQPILEAAAAGLPVIATPVGVVPELITSHETGFIVPADPDAIADRIMQLRDPATRLAFGNALRERVRQQFDWKHVMDRYMELYRSL